MPPSRESCLYTPYYCEENIWHLARRHGDRASRRTVAIISNEHRTCALWRQRAAPRTDAPVVWDYHVILITTGDGGAQVHDLDTTLGFPEPLTHYLRETFRPELRIDPRLQPRFRLVEAEVYASELYSDRSHMVGPDGAYQAPPPPWPTIGRPGGTLPLMAAIDPLRGEIPGVVVDLEELVDQLA